MNITSEMIKQKKVIGRSGSGDPILMVETTGGLFALFCKKDDSVETLSTAPHRAIAMFMAEQKDPEIKWKDLDKDLKKHVKNQFDTYRNIMFSPVRLNKSHSEDYLLYDTESKEFSVAHKSEVIADYQSGQISDHTLIRNLYLTEAPTLMKDHHLAEQSRQMTNNPLGGAEGKWFVGVYKHPMQGSMKTPRVKYMGMAGSGHVFEKEDGHRITVPNHEMLSHDYKFIQHPDQSESMTAFSPPDYNDERHLSRMNRDAHPYIGREYTLRANQGNDAYRGSHIAISLHSPENKDESHKLMGFQRAVHDKRHLGRHLTELAHSLWNSYGIKVKLAPSLGKQVAIDAGVKDE